MFYKVGMRFGVLALVGLVVTACSLQIANLRPIEEGTMAQYEERQTFFLFGVGQTKMVDAVEVCGGSRNIARVEVEETFIDVLLSSVTFGIYTPRTARVYCVR